MNASAGPPVITISASYGSAGSRVGPEVARLVGVPFLDRAIPAAVSARLDVSFEDVLAHEQSPHRTLSRLAARVTPALQMFAGAPAPPDALPWGDELFHAATEEALHEQAAAGGVILGRAGAIVLRRLPHAFHVRLDGPRDRRLAKAMMLEHLEEAEAERALRAADMAREAYVRHWYHQDPRALDLYHLIIDSTAIALDACAELITLAWRSQRPL